MELTFCCLTETLRFEFHRLVEDVGIALEGQVGDDNESASLEQASIRKFVVFCHNAMDGRYRRIQAKTFIDDLIQIAHLCDCFVRPLIVVIAESFSHRVAGFCLDFIVEGE
jgi:hypothetical protein